jgi:hypothetical protein
MSDVLGSEVQGDDSSLGADSDEVAQGFRFDGARDSDMMPPRARSLAS